MAFFISAHLSLLLKFAFRTDADMQWLESPLTIFGKMYFLLISENEFYYEIKRNGMTSFTDFMITVVLKDYV